MFKKFSSFRSTLWQKCYWLERLKTEHVTLDKQKLRYVLIWEQSHRLATLISRGDKGRILHYVDMFNRPQRIDKLVYKIVSNQLNYLYYCKFKNEVLREQAKAEEAK